MDIVRSGSQPRVALWLYLKGHLTLSDLESLGRSTRLTSQHLTDVKRAIEASRETLPKHRVKELLGSHILRLIDELFLTTGLCDQAGESFWKQCAVARRLHFQDMRMKDMRLVADHCPWVRAIHYGSAVSTATEALRNLLAKCEFLEEITFDRGPERFLTEEQQQLLRNRRDLAAID